MNIFKKISLYFSYRKVIKKNRVSLLGDYGIRIDNADRLYTVINIPTDMIDEPYNLRKVDVDSLATTYIRDYVSRLASHLNKIGLSELYDYYKPIEKVDKYSYLLVIGYKNIDTVKFNLYLYRVLPSILVISGLLYLILR
jgi:hypothetical protein